MASQNYDDFIVWITDQHSKILDCENQALDRLKAADKDAYKDKMKEKATMIADLETGCAPFLANMPANISENVKNEISRFSTSAKIALNLDSVFYMSALLYRDEHKDGEPDNLLVFIDNFKDSNK